MCELGTLQSVDLRCIWPNEAQDFTPWLAEEENLARLAETLNMELELEAQEIDVGNFRADLLCRNTEDNSRVLIENQLAQTDHKHLGQILTYAPGLNVATIVWIAEEFREEHRAALDWQNEITAEHFQFFGVEIRLWRIGESPPAPQFNIVSSPNISDDLSWQRGQGVQRTSYEGLTETQRRQLKFWEGFVKYLADQGSPIPPPTPQPRPSVTVATGTTFFTLFATRATRWLRVQLRMTGENATAHFHLLKKQRPKIDSELSELEWDEKPDKKASSISLPKNDTDLTDEADWPNRYAWLKCTLEKFDEVFRHRIRGLNAADWQPQDEDDN
jgi:hypothetical protein